MTHDYVAIYINECPAERQDILKTIRQTIQKALPEAQEVMKYGMPTYFYQESLVHFANAKQHIGFYPTPAAISHFSEQLSAYKTSKGAVQFPLSQEIPFELIKEMSLWRWQQVLAKTN